MSVQNKVLFVDDEPIVLKGYERQLRGEFSIETADGPQAALRLLSEGGPYAVVVSDMRMPEMDGVEFLTRVRQQWPDTVRLMLTGNNDKKTTMDAVNQGHVFRFLWKPCPAEVIATLLRQALEHHRLTCAERELLSTTLNESVRLMAEMLSMMNPMAFGRLSRIRRLVTQIAAKMSLQRQWEVETAATLCLVGCVSVPDKTLARISQGEVLALEEEAAFQSHPEVGRRLISRIPRLERVADLIGLQESPWSALQSENAESDALRLEANVLKVAIDFDLQLTRGQTPEAALRHLDCHPELYCPAIIEALTRSLEVIYETRSVLVRDLEDGMILNEPVFAKTGELLVAGGYEVALTLRERLVSFLETARGVREPINVLKRLYIQVAL